MNGSRITDYLDDLERNLMLAVDFTGQTTYEDFEKAYMNQYAVMRALEIVGESVKRIPEDLKATEAEIPWKAMAGMRDRLIHGYDNVNIALVWHTATITVPRILPLVSRFRRKLADESELK